MPLAVLRPGAAPLGFGRRHLSVAFVNNMPDGAFAATERQFLGLVEAGSGLLSLEVRCYTLAGVPRSERILERIAADYFPLEQLWDSAPDALIVTGANPLAPTLRQEPYWDDLARVLHTFVGTTASVLLSCLSAHAALEVFDGVGRDTLAVKCTGIFPQEVVTQHPLTRDLSSSLVLPHSRLNDVPETSVRAAGYQVLVASEAIGWSLVTKEVGATQVVLVQGHPEYDPSSLLREYRRDADRYASGVRAELPQLPIGCVAEVDRGALEQLHRTLVAGTLDPASVAAFPFEQAAGRACWPWRAAATTLYTNWLAEAHKRSS